MSQPRRDASIDYEDCAPNYPSQRRADPRIAEIVDAALGDAQTVLNVGAGSGSYEPRDRWVLAVEPSAGMRAQRPADQAPAIAASAEALPLDEDAVDAAMAMITVHHWNDPAAGLRELRRVTRGPVLVLTFDIDVLASFWMITDYLPEALTDDRRRFPTIEEIAETLGSRSGCVDTDPDRLHRRVLRGALCPPRGVSRSTRARGAVGLAATAAGCRATRARGFDCRPAVGRLGCPSWRSA